MGLMFGNTFSKTQIVNKIYGLTKMEKYTERYLIHQNEIIRRQQEFLTVREGKQLDAAHLSEANNLAS